jgi:hypothetical protein
MPVRLLVAVAWVEPVGKEMYLRLVLVLRVTRVALHYGFNTPQPLQGLGLS